MISVIIPSYNCEKYLPQAVDSVLIQNYRDMEIIVVDDGSKDNTKAIVEDYLRKHPGRIRYIYQDNAGVSSARNKGIKEANGKYLAFLDSDDVWKDDFIVHMLYISLSVSYRIFNQIFSLFLFPLIKL